jgi:hypothetical protein
LIGSGLALIVRAKERVNLMGNKYRSNKENVVTLKVYELEELVYKASFEAARKTEQQLFGGLMSFFNRLFDDNERIIETLDYLKLSLQETQKKKPATRKKKEVKKEKVEEVKESIPTFGTNKLPNLFENLPEEERKKLSEAIMKSIEENRVLIPSGVSVTIPEFIQRRYDE